MVGKGSGHSNYWRLSRRQIKQWRYMRNPNSSQSMLKPPSPKGWLHTLEASIGIQQLLKEHGVESFRSRSFNQDPLENLLEPFVLVVDAIIIQECLHLLFHLKQKL